MNKIYVLGVGPGNPDYVLPVVRRKAEECEVLCGGRRNLDLFKACGKEEILISADVSPVLGLLQEMRLCRQVGVLVSGDPGLYSFLTTLLTVFGRDELEVYPGISSLQYLFARGAMPWHDASITSLHGRRPGDLAGLAELVGSKARVAFLTDTHFPAGEIARFLVDKGVKGKRALVGEDLSYPEERIRDLPLEEWVGMSVRDLCVMVIYDG